MNYKLFQKFWIASIYQVQSSALMLWEHKLRLQSSLFDQMQTMF